MDSADCLTHISKPSSAGNHGQPERQDRPASICRGLLELRPSNACSWSAASLAVLFLTCMLKIETSASTVPCDLWHRLLKLSWVLNLFLEEADTELGRSNACSQALAVGSFRVWLWVVFTFIHTFHRLICCCDFMAGSARLGCKMCCSSVTELLSLQSPAWCQCLAGILKLSSSL